MTITSHPDFAKAVVERLSDKEPGTIIQSRPAFDYVQGNGVYKTKDVFAMPFETINHGTMYHQFTFGTIAGHARLEGKSEIGAIARCVQLAEAEPGAGHKLAWAFANGVSLTTGKREHKIICAQAWGDVIELDGSRYELARASNNNVKLIPV